ncbi:siderophore-interacting protein [Zobellella endophytica]|nr:siderophore-interacting protein [Zobellella endophytica]
MTKQLDGAPPRARLAEVVKTEELTPHLRRIVVAGPELTTLPEDTLGRYVKVLLPGQDGGRPNLALRGPAAAIKRSYTVQHYDAARGELSLDFVVNRHRGPATRWAAGAEVGHALGIAGPGPRKPMPLQASHYLLVGDLTSINALWYYAERLPAGARADVLIEIPTAEDRQALPSLPGVRVHWIVEQPDSRRLLQAVQACTGVSAQSEVFLGTEAGKVRAVKGYLLERTGISSLMMQTTGYWKRGVDAERFGKEKQQNPL